MTDVTIINEGEEYTVSRLVADDLKTSKIAHPCPGNEPLWCLYDGKTFKDVEKAQAELDKARLTYTQHTVAWPTLPLREPDSIYDEVNIGLDAKDGGTHGEFGFYFYRWSEAWDRTRSAVQIRVFGDGLIAFYHPAVQSVIRAWQDMDDPDDLTPEGLILLLERSGAKASSYHAKPNGTGRALIEAEIRRARDKIAELEAKLR